MPSPRAKVIIRRMFVETADENYILSRAAFLNGLKLDFWWLGAHAIEKYLKAILLFNDHSVKKHGHDIEALFAKAEQVRPDIQFGPFINPQITGADWSDLPIRAFVARLNSNGDPHNRYLTYGYRATIDDLLKLDQLAWMLRRHCRTLVQALSPNAQIDWVKVLRDEPDKWRIDEHSPIERLVNGTDRPALRSAFLKANKPFAPDNHPMEPCSRMFFMSNSPLVALFISAKEGRAGRDTIEALQWALDNIKLSGEDADQIRAAIAQTGNQ